MKMVLAVSGGVDSMAMLDIFLHKFPPNNIVIATFDHGARESSKNDADFVEKIVKLSAVSSALNLRFYRGEAPKTAKISEEEARDLRYGFLRKIAHQEKGEIFTAHHLDDLIESIIINYLRGTGIRGLAPMTSYGIRRPFIDGFLNPKEFNLTTFDKKTILEYAAKHKIIFRQDPTNTEDNYLRNRIRGQVLALDPDTKQKIFKLWREQKAIIQEIDSLVENLVPEDLRFKRATFQELDGEVAMEILRGGLNRAGVSTTRPQRKEFLKAILEYKSGKKFNLPNNKLVEIKKQEFCL